MAVSTITYTDKVTLNENASVADINKCKASDMNEIKSVVNNNATELNNLKTMEYIRGTLTNNQTITTNYVNVLYNSDTVLGTGLDLTNGKITIESDNIKGLIISQSLRTSDWGATTFYVQVMKNDVLHSQTIQNTSNIKFFDIISVAKNDIIDIQCYCSTQKTFNATDVAYNYIEILGING